MKVWCLEYKEKNMNNENKLLEYDEVCPYSEGRAAVRKGEFWDMWMRMENLFLQTLPGQENQGFHIIMRNHFVMVGLKYMIKWGRMTIAI